MKKTFGLIVIIIFVVVSGAVAYDANIARIIGVTSSFVIFLVRSQDGKDHPGGYLPAEGGLTANLGGLKP